MTKDTSVIPDQKIRLAPAGEPRSVRSNMPLARSRRWSSPSESDGLVPTTSVFVTQKAYVRFCAHAGSDLEHEVGGGLVGKWREDRTSGAPFVVVEAVLPARYTRQGSTFLTFTQDTLVAMNEEMETHYPGKRLVGWYHTHPRMGVFLSGYDLFLHRNFFPEPWQVALVMEPCTLQGGFFIRQTDGALDPQHYFGFYEMQVDSRQVVHWTNLKPESQPEFADVKMTANGEGGNGYES